MLCTYVNHSVSMAVSLPVFSLLEILIMCHFCFPYAMRLEETIVPVMVGLGKILQGLYDPVFWNSRTSLSKKPNSLHIKIPRKTTSQWCDVHHEPLHPSCSQLWLICSLYRLLPSFQEPLGCFHLVHPPLRDPTLFCTLLVANLLEPTGILTLEAVQPRVHSSNFSLHAWAVRTPLLLVHCTVPCIS